MRLKNVNSKRVQTRKAYFNTRANTNTNVNVDVDVRSKSICISLFVTLFHLHAFQFFCFFAWSALMFSCVYVRVCALNAQAHSNIHFLCHSQRLTT